MHNGGDGGVGSPGTEIGAMLRICPNGERRRDALRMVEYGGDPWETVMRSFVWRSWVAYDDTPTPEQWREIGRCNGVVIR